MNSYFLFLRNNETKMDTKYDEEELTNLNISKDDSTSASLPPHDDSLSVTDDLTERFSQQQV